MRAFRIGSGAGYAGDRIDPAQALAEHGELDALVFECLAERTIALAQLRRQHDPNTGFDPLLPARMRAVHRRGNGALPTPLIFGPLVLDAEGRLAELDGDALTLTGREWDILEALVLADGRTVARERLQGDGSSNALEVYVSRLRPRLESAGVLIRTVRGFGYRLERLK